MIASPCTGICKLHEGTGWCLGCGRSGDEIADWRVNNKEWRDIIWDEIPTRLAQLDVACRRLPWTTDEIRDFVVSSLEAGEGTWVMGVVGGVAEFSAAKGARTRVETAGEHVCAQTRNGAIQMLLNDDIRALTFDPPNSDHAQRVVLAVKRERGRLPKSDAVTCLGYDQRALMHGDGTHLFDLGLGRKEARFCVRVAEGKANTTLRKSCGLLFANALPIIANTLMAESPTRVVETALGRIEVQGRIPPPDAQSPDGPHTHLLPNHLASGRALPVGMDLPRAYLPGAIFYPRQH